MIKRSALRNAPKKKKKKKKKTTATRFELASPKAQVIKFGDSRPAV